MVTSPKDCMRCKLKAIGFCYVRPPVPVCHRYEYTVRRGISYSQRRALNPEIARGYNKKLLLLPCNYMASVFPKMYHLLNLRQFSAAL